MAITYTTRFGLPKWGDPSTDGPTHDQFNNMNDNLERYAAHDDQGALGVRPGAGRRGNYWWATDKAIMYRDDGTRWQEVAGNVENWSASNTALADLAAQVQALVGTSNLDVFIAGITGRAPTFEVRTNGGVFAGDPTATRYILANDTVHNVALYIEDTGANAAERDLQMRVGTNFAGRIMEWLKGTVTLGFMDANGDLSLPKFAATSNAPDAINDAGGLIVAGNGQIGGNVSVGGNETVTGNLTVTGNINSPNLGTAGFNQRVYLNNGTWTLKNKLRGVRIRAIGAGGAGGNAQHAGPNSTFQRSAAGGGGGGGYVEQLFDATELPASVNIIVGNGGTPAGTAAGDGHDGGNSSFNAGGMGFTGCTAYGGSGGTGSTPNDNENAALGGLGGSGVTADTGGVIIQGQTGGVGSNNWYVKYPDIITTGIGGDSVLGMGGRERANCGPGINGQRYGGGGSGAGSNQDIANQQGGNGADGAVIIEEFYY